MRKTLVVALAVALIAPTAPATASAARPTTYIVSRTPGETLEGISVSPDGTMYVTGSASGAVYRGRVTDPRLHPFIPANADGRGQAAGVHVDRWGRVFVAGYDNGVLYVYDRSGRLLLTRPTVAGANLNDFTFTDDAVYVTDSGTGRVWRAALAGTSVGPLREWLGPDSFTPRAGFLNGIVATPGGRGLIVTDQDTNLTFHVDIGTRTVTPLTLIGAPDGLFSADGMVLEGHRLYGVYNFPDEMQPGGFGYVTRLLRLSDDFRTATWLADSAEAPGGNDAAPTTIARDCHRLLWVNSQLGNAPGTPPYTVTQVPGLR